MRTIVVALSAAAFALASLSLSASAKAPQKTKMGCIVGKEKYDAVAGKCMPKPAKTAAQKAVKKA